MKDTTLALIVREGGKTLSELLRLGLSNQPKKEKEPPPKGKASVEEVVTKPSVAISPEIKLTKVESHEVPLGQPSSEVSTDEIILYQNQEIGKILLLMQGHFVKKLRIHGKPCDCVYPKHILNIIALSEETIPMVVSPDVYYRMIEWAEEIAPKCTIPAIASGLHDNEYPSMALQARDFRKDIIGTLDTSALFPPKSGSLTPAEELYEATPEDIERVKAAAHKRIDEIMGSNPKETMIPRVCMYCGQTYGYKPGYGMTEPTHGICPKCWAERFPGEPQPEEESPPR